MEGEGKKEAWSTEQGQIKGDQDHEFSLPSAHTIGHDSWQQVGFMLATSFNCGYILSFSNLMLVPLGWTWGVVCMVVVWFYSLYVNWLLAPFHFINGQRFIRYRDLMGYLYSRKMCHFTWVLQFVTLLLGNMGFILLGGRALKEINSEFSHSPLRLQWFITITGVTFFIFAFFIPTISAMRGKTNKQRDYVIHGKKVDRLFNAFNAISAIIVSSNTGLLTEIQSTLRKPAVTNMRKALYVQFSGGILFYYAVPMMGYWAYGSKVSKNLPNELSGPKWAKIFVAPIHDALDTKFLKLDKSMNSKENLKCRFFLRVFFFIANTFVTSAIPFMGDFVNLFGSFSLDPLTSVFPSMIFIKIKGKTARPEKNLWHWFNFIIFSFLAVVTTIAAVRLILNNVQKYNFFADT
ncbi:hypothetical protein CerSpe_187050 [Prunus speciosa]